MASDPSRTSELAPEELAKEIADYVSEQKVKTHKRMQTYEGFLVPMRAPTDERVDVKEALTSLVTSAEEEYGTLLHLERILIRNARIAAQERAFKLAAKTEAPPSSNGASGLDDFYGGKGFVMGASGESPSADLGDFDPLSGTLDIYDKENVQLTDDLEEGKDYEEDDDKVSVIPVFKTRKLPGVESEELARSLPVTIPIPPEKAAANRVKFPSSDEDGAAGDGSKNIHRKMIEISNSMYEESLFPSSPRRKYNQD